MSAFQGNIHVFGGTSDAIRLCQMLERFDLTYSVSVATEAGREAAGVLKGKIWVGRLNIEEMEVFFTEHQVDLVIDATHPFATEVSKNVIKAASNVAIPSVRYERPSQIDLVDNPLLIKVHDIDQACEEARKFGKIVFLTTGSKDLPYYHKALPEKKIIARVLPTAGVIQSCADLGMGINQIVAIKGPFSREMNEAMYRFYQPNVVITKESGNEGGYQEKVLPCLALGIPCIVICRPEQTTTEQSFILSENTSEAKQSTEKLEHIKQLIQILEFYEKERT